MFELIRHCGGDPRALAADLPTVHEDAAWISWADYIAMISALGELAGGASGVATAMREVTRNAYSDLRGLAGFFPGPIPFLAFVTHHLNRELVAGAVGVMDTLGPDRVRLRYRIEEGLVGSRLYFEGTVTLLALFPTHFGLPEARIQVVSLTERTSEMIATFAKEPPKVRWGALIGAGDGLTPREQEVLHLVCSGMTNAEIATTLGTAASTVKTQISSILAKMEVANRTELASLAARRP